METTTTHKTITCPDCNGTALLSVWPAADAGVWECQNPACGVSDSHEHTEIISEEVENTYMNAGEPDAYTSSIDVCAECGVQVEGDY